jgi:hypothetical protein
MQTPRIFLCYAPRAGLRGAVAYIASGNDVYGWYAGPGPSGAESAYFALADYYTKRPTRALFVPDADLHTPWADEATCHELARMQEMFSREWLFRRDDPGAERELARYREAELAAGDIGIRYERIARLSKMHANWTFYSPGFERGVLKALARRWPLDFQGLAA